MQNHTSTESMTAQRRFSYIPLSDHELDELHHSELWANAKLKASDILLQALTFTGQPLRFTCQELSYYVDSAMRIEQGTPCQKILLDFIQHQSDTGQIPDVIEKSMEPVTDASVSADTGYIETARRYSSGIDQEVSLIYALCCYIHSSGDSRILSENIHGKSLVNHMINAMDYLWTAHLSSATGLLCQRSSAKPESETADIYVNALALCTLNSLLSLPQVAGILRANWQPRQSELATSIRITLWSPHSQRYLRHHSDPKASKDNDREFYPLGTALAITAGLLNLDEVSHSLYATLDYLEKESVGEKPGWIPHVAAVYAKAGYPVQAMEILRDFAENILCGPLTEPVESNTFPEQSARRMQAGGFLRALRQLQPMVKAHTLLEPLKPNTTTRSFGQPNHVKLSFKKIHFSEKRDVKRVPIEFPAHILVKKVRPHVECSGAIHHPSCFGVGLKTTEFIPEGSTLELLAHTEEMLGGKPCRLRGRVTWSRSKVGARLYVCGVELDRRSKDLKRWRKFILDQLIHHESNP